MPDNPPKWWDHITLANILAVAAILIAAGGMVTTVQSYDRRIGSVEADVKAGQADMARVAADLAAIRTDISYLRTSMERGQR